MKTNQHLKRLDIIITAFLTLFLLISLLYRFQPMIFLNPDFPILEEKDLMLPEKFLSRNFSGSYNFNKHTYEAEFKIDDTSHSFYGFYNLTLFSNIIEAEMALQQDYQKYVDDEGISPYRITNIPLTGFSSKADYYLLWCTQYLNKVAFDAEQARTCYYWAVYDQYLSKTTLRSMGPSWGRQYSLELFREVIKSTEDDILSKINR